MQLLDHPLKRIQSFNIRYIRGQSGSDPDWLDYKLCHSSGEFSAHADIAFEKHLQKKHYIYNPRSPF